MFLGGGGRGIGGVLLFRYRSLFDVMLRWNGVFEVVLLVDDWGEQLEICIKEKLPEVKLKY